MFWKKKQEEKLALPDLPMAAENNETNEWVEESEIHNLPSFPDSPMKKGFSQSIIKNAVETNDIEEESLPSLPSFDKNPSTQINKLKTMEMEEWAPKQFSAPQNLKSESKSVFVRIDKFQDARNSLDIIKEKLSEMDEILKEIKEVKMKEDQEIMQWEKEIMTIRSRINSISEEIFENYS